MILKFFLALWLASGLDAASMLDQGFSQRKQGRFEEAILSLQGHLKKDGGSARGWYELGQAYVSDGQYAKAVDAYRLALSHGFNQPQCHCALSLALRENFKPAAAMTEARRCLELLPDYAGAWNLVGNIETDLGHLEMALQAYQQALKLKPHYAHARYNLGLALGALGRNQESERALQDALMLQPAMAEAWSAMGKVQLRQKRSASALKSFQEARRLNADDADAAWGLSRAWYAMGDQGRAQKEARSYQRLMQQADNQKYFKNSRQNRRVAAREAEAWDRDARERN